jgi:hypothetical protein
VEDTPQLFASHTYPTWLWFKGEVPAFSSLTAQRAIFFDNKQRGRLI